MTTDHTPASPTSSPNGIWARCLRSDHSAFVAVAKSYWYPIYAWLRRVGLSPARAGDAVKAAFTRWATFEPPRKGDEGAARMREWLLARITAMVTKGIKPSPSSVLAIDEAWAEQRYGKEPPGEADAIFLRRWAYTIIEFATEIVRAEYERDGRAGLFAELLPLGASDANAGLVEKVARDLSISTGGIRKEVFEFRTRFRAVLQDVIGHTVADPASAKDEMAALLTACGAVATELPAPAPTILGMVQPGELYARAMKSVQLSSGGVGQWKPPTIEEIARLFPAYDGFEMLGCGGMGAVFRARQKVLDRDVAIKLMPLEVSVEKTFAERFVREARAMAKLSHPNIVTVHDFGQTSEGHLFFVMDFVDGANLYETIHRTGIEPAKVLHVVAQVCEALAYAHEKGIIHRDIKPANVLVGKDGSVKVVDFGLARITDPKQRDAAGGQATMTGMLMGTPDYMAPEQTRGMDVDHRADVYSLGVVLYEALVGEVPQGIFDPPSHRVNVDKRIDHIVARALHQQPERRFQNTKEFKAAVEAVQKGPAAPQTPARPVRLPIQTPAKKKRSPATAIAAVLLLGAISVAAVFFNKEPELTEAERKALAAKNATPAPTPEPELPIPGEIVAEPAPVVPPKPVEPIATKPVEPVTPEPAVVEAKPAPEMIKAPESANPPPTGGPDPEVVKWLSGEMEKHTARYQEDVMKPFDAAVAKLREQYLGAVDR